jgi:hypothetical protein
VLLAVGASSQFLAYKMALSLFARQTLNLLSRSSSEQDSKQADLAIRVKAIDAGPIISKYDYERT